MTIKEVEEQTGLTRSNIRFYEREKLIEPTRNDKNGYRDYSESDIKNIKKIAYLRTLEISIEDIRNIIIYVKWLMNYPYGELVREYLSNYMCFVALSAELFIILFVHGVLKSIVAVLFVDTVVLIGLLIVGIFHKMTNSRWDKSKMTNRFFRR